MTRDTFDMFSTNTERGRFGDNESSAVRGNDSVRSDLVDIAMVNHLDSERPKSVLVSLDGQKSRAVWLPKSQIEIVTTGPIERKKAWHTIQAVTITLPLWLAKDKGLV